MHLQSDQNEHELSLIHISVNKTGRLLVISESVKSFSVPAEIITRVNEKAFWSLIAPPMRLTGWDITVPLARGEGFHMINTARIVEKIKELATIE